MTPNPDEVICPNCTHQFRAIPVNVQQMLIDRGVRPPFLKQLDQDEVDDLLDRIETLQNLVCWDVPKVNALIAERDLLEEANTQLREQNNAVGAACADLEHQIDDDEALMRELYDLLESYCGYTDETVTKLRARLETTK